MLKELYSIYDKQLKHLRRVYYLVLRNISLMDSVIKWLFRLWNFS